MNGRLKIVGGAYINPAGEFEVVTGRGNTRAPMFPGPTWQYMKDVYHFLNSKETFLDVNEVRLLKTTSSKGLPTCTFSWLEPDYKIAMYLKPGGYVTVVMELPFADGSVELQGPSDDLVVVDDTSEEY